MAPQVRQLAIRPVRRRIAKPAVVPARLIARAKLQHRARLEPQVFQHRARLEPQVFQNRARLEPQVFQHRARLEPQVFQHRARLEPQVFQMYQGPAPRRVIAKPAVVPRQLIARAKMPTYQTPRRIIAKPAIALATMPKNPAKKVRFAQQPIRPTTAVLWTRLFGPKRQQPVQVKTDAKGRPIQPIGTTRYICRIMLELKKTWDEQPDLPTPSERDIEHYLQNATGIKEHLRQYVWMDPRECLEVTNVTYEGHGIFQVTLKGPPNQEMKIVYQPLTESLSDGAWEGNLDERGFVYPTPDGKSEYGVFDYRWISINGVGHYTRHDLHRIQAAMAQPHALTREEQECLAYNEAYTRRIRQQGRRWRAQQRR